MPEVTQLTLAVDSRQVKTAAGDLDKLSSAGKRSEGATNNLTRSFKGLGGAAAAVASSFFVKAIIEAADGYKNLNARLQLVSKTSAEFARAQREVLDISQRTRTGLESTATLYGNLSRSTQSLGVSQDDLLKVTESINQALIVSGTSAQSAQAALTQLGQGFASGTLRGEELNSVLEQAPRLAQAIADGLGVPIGKLRELGQAGELSAEKVFRALQKSGNAIETEFKQIPITVSGATTQAASAISVLIGVIDESTGSTSALAGGISSVAELVKELATEIQRASRGAEDVGFLARAFTTVSQTVKILWSDVVFVFQGIGREIGGIAAQLAALTRLDFRGFTAISDAMKEDAARAKAELDKYQLQVLNPFLNSRGRGTTGGADPRLIGTTPANETVGFRSPALVPEDGKKPKPTRTRTVVDEAAQYLEGLMRQLDATQKLSTEQQLLRDLELGRLGKVTPAQRAALVETAKKIDLEKELNTVIEEFAKLDADAQEKSNRLRAEGAAVYESTRTPVERLSAETARLDKLLKDGAISWDTYSRAMLDSLENFDRVSAGANATGKEIDQVAKNALENIQRSLGDELTNVLDGDFKNIGDSFTRLLKRMVAEAAAADILKATGMGNGQGGTSGLIQGVMSLFGGVKANAKGGVYNSPGLSAYSGSIVSKPTLFPFARGAGLMGEAGPEVILPLERGKDGKLGVVAGGGGASVTVNVINQGGGSLNVVGQSRRTNDDGSLSIDVMVEALQGLMADNVANGSGAMARAMESRYGLRPSLG